MCYVEDKSFSEIAEILDLSKSRIAQLHKDALNRLRNRVRGRGDFSC
ncbi:sigma factor-like helix-turn-helix DNA-binding protein [Microbulbifer rhizosphaerae]